MFSFLRKPASHVPSASLHDPAPVIESGYYIHPAAMLFPMLHGTAIGELAADIKFHGLREPIVLDSQGRILDGRNRLRACHLVGVEPRFVEWDGQGSPVAFVLSRNLHRRHLNESQRSMVAAHAKHLFEHEAIKRRQEELNQNEPLARETPTTEGAACANWHSGNLNANREAGDLMNVSPRSVARASKLIAGGDEEVLRAVESGTVTVSDAASICHLPKERQRAALAAVVAGQARTLCEASELIGDAPSSEGLSSDGPTTSEPSANEPVSSEPASDSATAESTGGSKRARRSAARSATKLSPKRAVNECRSMEDSLTKLTERVDRLDRCEEAKAHVGRIRGGLQLALLAARACARSLAGNG
jgi:ParB-like nuclease family protein